MPEVLHLYIGPKKPCMPRRTAPTSASWESVDSVQTALWLIPGRCSWSGFDLPLDKYFPIICRSTCIIGKPKNKDEAILNHRHPPPPTQFLLHCVFCTHLVPEWHDQRGLHHAACSSYISEGNESTWAMGILPPCYKMELYKETNNKSVEISCCCFQSTRISKVKNTVAQTSSNYFIYDLLLYWPSEHFWRHYYDFRPPVTSKEQVSVLGWPLGKEGGKAADKFPCTK